MCLTNLYLPDAHRQRSRETTDTSSPEPRRPAATSQAEGPAMADRRAAERAPPPNRQEQGPEPATPWGIGSSYRSERRANYPASSSFNQPPHIGIRMLKSSPILIEHA